MSHGPAPATIGPANSSQRAERPSSALATTPLVAARTNEKGRIAAMAQQLAMAFATSGVEAALDAVAEGGARVLEEDPVRTQARYELLLAGSRDEAIGTLMRECTRVFWDLAKPVVIAAGSSDPDGDARIVMAMLDGLFFDALTKGEHDPDLLRRGIRQAARSISP
jgi:hypothetical protein